MSVHSFCEIHQDKFNPLFIWAKIITEVRSYPGAEDKVNAFFGKGKMKEITSAHVKKLSSCDCFVRENPWKTNEGFEKPFMITI